MAARSSSPAGAVAIAIAIAVVASARARPPAASQLCWVRMGSHLCPKEPCNACSAVQQTPPTAVPPWTSRYIFRRLSESPRRANVCSTRATATSADPVLQVQSVTVAAANWRSTPREDHGQTILGVVSTADGRLTTCMFGRDGGIRTRGLLLPNQLHPAWRLAATTLAGRRLTWPGVCARWLPLWLPISGHYKIVRTTQPTSRAEDLMSTVSCQMTGPGPAPLRLATCQP